jgi:hypothetical protein
MSVHQDSHDDNQKQGGFLTLRWGLVLLGFLIIVGTLLFTEHRAHVLGALIWLPLLLCPLMHMFMHGGHGAHGGHGEDGSYNHDDRRRVP